MSSISGWIWGGDRCQMFPSCSPKHSMAWHDTDGPPGAGCTLKHYSLDPYGGHGVVRQQLIRCHGWKFHQFWVGFEVTDAKCFHSCWFHFPRHSYYFLYLDYSLWHFTWCCFLQTPQAQYVLSNEDLELQVRSNIVHFTVSCYCYRTHMAQSKSIAFLLILISWVVTTITKYFLLFSNECLKMSVINDKYL
jgi:hypothetical protein